MNRKEFLKAMAMGGGALALTPSIVFGKDKKDGKSYDKKLTILHTNDQHSRVEPFEESDKKYPNQGGFARRATLVEKIRKEEKNLLLLDSGDVFQGTPYFNMFGGELEFKLMSMMGYDASTMGNHEFDSGLEGFLKALPNAKFPFICSNYDFSNTILAGKTHPYKTFNKDGIKVGIFGLGVKLEGLVGKKESGGTKWLDPIETAQKYSDILRKEQKCDLVICLSHLGYSTENKEDPNGNDNMLAVRSEGIDLILGGHTHTFFDAPVAFQNKAGKNVLVNQVGFAGLLLGRIDYYFDKNKKINQISWNNQTIDSSIIA